ERLRGGRPVGPAEVWEAIAQIPGEVESPAALGEQERVGDSIGTVVEQRRGFRGRPQVELAVRPPHAVRAVERGAVADRRQHVVQPVAGADVVMHVAGRYDAKSDV